MDPKKEMIENQLKSQGITDDAVLDAIREVDRALFVPEDMKPHAYEDRPLPIGKDQTISQPYIVAYMAQELGLGQEDVVLEVGTGCGYNAAVLSKIASRVYSVEIIEWLAELAKENLQKTKINNIHTKAGDGFAGWPEMAPFDAIILTAAPPQIPEPLKKQLKIGGRLLAPIGRLSQKLIMVTRTGEDNYNQKELLPVKFVPMTGKAQK